MINDQQRISHILEAIDKVVAMTNCTQEEFLQSATLKDAVSYNFLIIGEAAAQLSDAFKKKHPEIPWRVIVGMRNVLIHDYVRTNYTMIWKTAKEDLPSMSSELNSVISSMHR